MKSLDNLKESVILVGYSYGALLSFEMALQAERCPSKYPKIMNHIMLDGSPFMIKMLTSMYRELYGKDMQDIEPGSLYAFASMFSKDIQLVSLPVFY